MASRFEFNLYSYESVTTLGAEWAIPRSHLDDDEYFDENLQEMVKPHPEEGAISLLNQGAASLAMQDVTHMKQNSTTKSSTPIPLSASTAINENDPIQGYLKARITTEKVGQISFTEYTTDIHSLLLCNTPVVSNQCLFRLV